MGQAALFVGEPDEVVEARRRALREQRRVQAQSQAPRLVEPDRKQIEFRTQDLDALLPPTHRARSVWAVVERLDVRRFYEPIKARGSQAGRPCTDPKVLVALWLYATCEGVGSAHELERLCQAHDAYRWICGGVRVNYHTLSDFRSAHPQALDTWLTQMIAVLMQEGLVVLKRVAQDGTRVRASAGAGSFRRRQRLEDFVTAAREQVEAVKAQANAPTDTQRNARRAAAQQRAARDRAERVQRALEELGRIEQQREAMTDKERAATAETVNADLKTWRSLDRFLVRGTRKVTCVLLCNVLA
jgi:transposase